MGILNNYYVTDDTGNTFMLDKSCENDIENLMYGRISCFFVKFQSEDCQVKLHPKMLNSNFPMIMLCKADKFFAISKRLRNWTHISLFGFQPAVCGMRCDSSLAHEMLKNVKDTGSLFCESFILKKLCCLYLRIGVHMQRNAQQMYLQAKINFWICLMRSYIILNIVAFFYCLVSLRFSHMFKLMIVQTKLCK